MSNPHSTSGERQWNQELVAALEAERARLTRPPSWTKPPASLPLPAYMGPPASKADIAELVDAVANDVGDLGSLSHLGPLRAVS